MNEVMFRLIASVLSGVLFCMATEKLLGAIQQGGYKNENFMRWLKRKDNLFFNRLCVLTLCLLLSTAVVSLCFSFLGIKAALLISALPFMILLLAFCYVDERYALKVKAVPTGRYKRLGLVYFFFVTSVSYLWIALLFFLARWNGSKIYHLIAYVPFNVMPLLLPALFMLANAVTGVFEKMRNDKFVAKAQKKLLESDAIKVAIVGSYGKTSVKNILKTILQEKYTVVETPESYNTPMGIAKTVFSEEFDGKQVFIAEMGARKQGDIAELCSLVKPDYAIFTGVCAQHVQTFGSLENVWLEKKEILKTDAKRIVCGESVTALAKEEFGDLEKVLFVDNGQVKDVELTATGASFALTIGDKTFTATTDLLGEAAIENVLLAATLAFEMGLSVEEISSGIKKLQPTAHRLQLLKNNGVYILDDSYNCNVKGAKNAISALERFAGRKCIVTPGIVECGILEENINGELGAMIASANIDKVIFVGETLVGALKSGYIGAGGNAEAMTTVSDLERAKNVLSDWLRKGDAVLFLNDLPDVY